MKNPLPWIASALVATTLPLFSQGVSYSVAEFSKAAEAGDFEEALKMARSLAGQEVPPEGLPDRLVEIASRCAAENRLDLAAELYRLVLEKFPEASHISHARAELVGCYNYLRDLENCITQASANLEVEPESEWAPFWKFLIAQSHFRLWEFEKAKPLLEAFLQDHPDGDYTSYAQKYLGWIDPDWEVGPHGIIAYKGKLKEDVRIQRAVESFPEDLENGFRELEERLGVDLRPHTHVLLLFYDSGPKRSGLKASTFIVARENVPTIVMQFYTEFVARDPRGYRQTLTHELKHAGFKGAMGQAYENLPEWLTEGLAVWGADDVETRVRSVLSNKIVGKKDPFSALDGIDDLKHDHADYMEDVLAIEWLEQQQEGNVKRFCAELIAGRPYKEIWAELSGMPFEEAMVAANAHCRSRVEEVLGDSFEEFKTLRAGQESAFNAGKAASREWLSEGGQQGMEDWLEANSEHPAAPMGRLCLARALARAGDGEASRKILSYIIANDGPHCTVLDDAQFWMGVTHNWEQNFERARAEFGILLRDYPASSAAKQVVGKFQPAGPVLE